MKVKKRNGTLEPIDINKIHQVVEWATKDVPYVSASEVEIKAKIQFYDGIKTSDIHVLLIQSARDLISVHTNYDIVASRLTNYKLRKEVYGSEIIPPIYDIVVKNTSLGLYDKDVLGSYTKEEWDEINTFIKHDNDFKFKYAGLTSLIDMYLVKNRVTKELYETPQVVYILVSCSINMKDTSKTRLKSIKSLYDLLSAGTIGLPSPILAGVRTDIRRFSSCCLIETGDSTDSLMTVTQAVADMASNRAGIGIAMNSVRALNSPVKGGIIKHTGVVPFVKMYEQVMNAFSQGSMRKSSATIYYLGWHRDFLDLVTLKNNKGLDANRSRGLDHAFLLNETMYDRLRNGGNITLFCPNDVPDLVDAFYKDQQEFKRLYELYEKSEEFSTDFDSGKKIKKVLSAYEYFSTLMVERTETGRIYIANIDNINEHSSYDHQEYPIKMSNLCVAPETLVMTKEFGNVEIKSVAGQNVHVWNGEEWSEVTICKTSDSSKLIKVILVDNISLTSKEIECTEYHKFYIKDMAGNVLIKPASELEICDTLEGFITPQGEKASFSIITTIDTGRVDETYCFTEPKRGRGMFNGVVTGNCLEITLPTKPITSDNDGLIALCTLGSINWGNIKKPSDFEVPCFNTVKLLDNLLDYQEYPLTPAKEHTRLFRPLGIGVNNLAYFLAKRGLKYDAKAIETVFDYAEAQYFYLLKASMELAKERGACDGNEHLKKNFVFENYSPDKIKYLKTFCKMDFKQDWQWLRGEIDRYGLRNSVLSAIMPSESNSVVNNCTNGIEPPRDFIVLKKNVPIIVPEYDKMKDNYHLLWEQESPYWYLRIVAVLQLFNDQAISANTFYHQKHTTDGKFSMSRMLSDMLTFHKMGGKTLYYANTGATVSKMEKVEVKEEENCASCTV